jgi:hypothetical protein
MSTLLDVRNAIRTFSILAAGLQKDVMAHSVAA